MAKILISFLIITSTAFANTTFPKEVQTAIESADSYSKVCENNAFRPYRDKKLEELSREDYFKLKGICASYSMSSILRAVQNINKLEKENIENLSKLPLPEKIQNIENRVNFLTDAVLNTPMTFAESLIFLVALQSYTKAADETKDKKLKKFISVKSKKIKENKVKIFETTLQHDITLILAESRNTEGGDPKEVADFKDFVAKFAVYSNELKRNLSCLSTQKCKICGDKFEKKCTAAVLKTENSDKEIGLGMIRDRYADATEHFFKRVNRF